ncbi:histidine kinase [Beutenbergia cavernae DSM 12333]|uniref:histidine kinase n=1 Tax=Beutenbergia cavernae (strain ATCC BAA-8 / DSM 12333 / CCUG 43141 / JCM 11478 / NBRC 16432 / NCIMB 13614 / HKI 0122) TaxID=471853 RepID=C5BWE3_BEUC1|nr:histidine kinase [Beutenbergia cavernae DSM 12333]
MVWLRRAWRDLGEDAGPTTAVWLFGLGALTIALGLVDVWGPGRGVAPAWHLVPLAVGCAAMTVRRRRPGFTLGVATVVFIADAILGGSFAVTLVLFDAIYAAERFGGTRLRRSVHLAAGVIVVGIVLASVRGGNELRDVLALGLQTGGLLGLPIWWASSVRQAAELAAAAEERARLEIERAESLERLAAAERTSAVEAERTRMARDLHDAVAGEVSAVVIHAEAALAAPPDHERDRAALTAVRAGGLAALAEMRTLIEILRARESDDDPDEQRTTPPRLTQDLPALLGGAVAVRVTGEASLQEHGLPRAVDQTAYRIVQECLTNVAKHGASPQAELSLTVDAATLEIDVSNRARPGVPTATGGHGVIGMNERATPLGGTVTAGIADDGGTWVVRARLPLPPADVRSRT